MVRKIAVGLSIYLLIIISVIWESCIPSESSQIDNIAFSYQSVPDKVDFNFHVKPILSDRCFKCHGPDKNTIEGGLSFNTK